MLSTGEWHKSVPRDYRENLRYRVWLLDRCRKEPVYRQAVLAGCKNDLLFWINSFGYQYNPLSKGVDVRQGPFVTWPFQDRALLGRPPGPKGILWCYENDRTGLVEKSRDMGASWLFLFVEYWLSAFHSGVQVLNISRSADAVDSKSKNSLFSKLRFIHKFMPEWLVGEVEALQFYFNFKKTDSEITGEASTGRAGAGGRGSVVFVDEFSMIKEDEKVRQTTASVTDCRFFNGTHQGTGTEFFKMTEDDGIVKIQMHWTRHPRKNAHLYSWDVEAGKPLFWRYDDASDEIVELSSPPKDFPEDYAFDRTGNPNGGPHPGIRSPWYDWKAADIGPPRLVAMELDINATGSASQFYEPHRIRQMMEKCPGPSWQGDIDFDSDTARPHQLVPHGEGPLRLWFNPGLNADGRLMRIPVSEYVIGVDPGTGRGATPTCFSIFDCGLGKKVGAYVDFWKHPHESAPVAVALCKAFASQDGTPAMLGWECPGPGLAFGDKVLKDFNFRNIYWKTETFNDEERQSDTPGWYAQIKSKLQLHSWYHAALLSGDFVNPDKGALKECLSYVHVPGSVEHPKARKNTDAAGAGMNHGDNVVADALAWLMAKKKAISRHVFTPQEPQPDVRSILGRRQFHDRRQKELAGRWA